MSIIGLSGRKQVGKDLTASIIQCLCFKNNLPHSYAKLSYEDFCKTYINTLANHWKVVKFADKLKDIVCLILGCTREQLEDETFKNTLLGEEWSTPYEDWNISYGTIWTPRSLMQFLGTDIGRNRIATNIWVNSTMANYTHSNQWIISDVRFPGEAKAIHNKEGIIIRINRPSIMSNDQHESETALDNYDNFDYVLDNSGDIPKLIEKVRDILILEGIIN